MMFNLIMISTEWDSDRASLEVDRVFEYTYSNIAKEFSQDGKPRFELLVNLPCLFMQEGTKDQVARVGQVTRPRIAGKNVIFEYSFEAEISPLKNSFIYENRTSLDMTSDFEFSRNHWAVKDVNLYRFLLRADRPRRQRPTVFQIGEHQNIEPTLASAMMPFHPSFDAVSKTIKDAAHNAGLVCRRADDIWENPAVIQDVVSLIDRSRVVVCDCTGRNPNVFYEAGIAHTLGREVILITQNPEDIPFDLRHLRYIPYLNNGEGRSKLLTTLQSRMETIVGH